MLHEIAAVRAEHDYNIQAAIHNRNVFFTGEGQSQQYKNAEFLNMICVANNLVGVALDDE